MSKKDSLRARIIWQRDSHDSGLSYSRDHTIIFPGKTTIKVSSGITQFGNKNLINPEEMLAASLASCMMMTYIYLSARNKMIVVSYRDDVEATLNKSTDTVRFIEGIKLSPVITFLEAKSSGFKAMAIRIINEAHNKCIISNTIRSNVHIEPVFVWA